MGTLKFLKCLLIVPGSSLIYSSGLLPTHLIALDLLGDTKDYGGLLLDCKVNRYSTVVLFRINLCRSAKADGS